MHVISFKFQPTMKVNIYNQCPYFELTDGRYYSSEVDRNGHLYWKVNTANEMSVDLMPFRSTFGGVLTCALKTRYVNSSNPPKLIHIRLFVAWKSEGYKKLRIFVQLVRCYKFLHWDKIKLEEYYQRYVNQFSPYTGPIKDTWLTDDGAVLMTKLELDFTQRDGVLNITISEGIGNDHTRRPIWIDPKM
jgi:hypothetical protein